jgi:hypothetical protein
MSLSEEDRRRVWAFAPELSRSNYLWNPSLWQHIGEVSNSTPEVRHRIKDWGVRGGPQRGIGRIEDVCVLFYILRIEVSLNAKVLRENEELQKRPPLSSNKGQRGAGELQTNFVRFPHIENVQTPTT